MKTKKTKETALGRIVMLGLLCAVIGVLIALGVVAIRKSKITAINKSVRYGREAFQSGDYKRAILHFVNATDSLSFASEGTSLNIAHALFHLGGKGTASKETGVDNVVKGLGKGIVSKEDSIKGKTDMDYYNTLSVTGEDKLIGSIAYNQVGVINYRSVKRDVTDETLRASAEYFKGALQKDPNNEFARYNYELLKRKIAYPELLMKRVKALVKENRYQEAYQLLKPAVAKDPSIETKNSGYLKRLEDIITIDSK